MSCGSYAICLGPTWEFAGDIILSTTQHCHTILIQVYLEQ